MSCHRRRRSSRSRVRAFTMVELVIVVTIIGIISAIAVPRMSAASSTATGNALKLTMANVRKAVDVFYAEHGRYPGYDPASGAASGEFFVDQLITYSDATGNTNATYAYPFIYGPYIRSPFPTNPTNHLQTVHVKTSAADADPAAGSVGWIAVLSSGDFGISATDASLDDVGIIDDGSKKLLRIY